MADKKITELDLGTPTDTDVIPYVDLVTGETKKAVKTDLIGPRGPQGFQGPQGIIGTQGSQGFQGITGPQGVQGFQGTEGPQGAEGPQGTQGFQGNEGSQGPQGFQGPYGTGAQGEVGPQGTQGYQGPEGTGSQGYQGPTGSQGPQGFQGNEGSQGPQGFQGPYGTGAQGEVGPQGTQGYQGPTGPKNTGQIFLSSAGGWPNTTSGCASNTLLESTTCKNNYYVLPFVDSSNKFASWDLIMPLDWDAGTVSAYFLWTASAFGDGAGVAWSIAGRSYANAELIDSGLSAYVSASDYGGTNYTMYQSSASIFGVSGAGANELVILQVGRWPGDAADNLTASALLLGVRLDYSRT